MKVRKYGVVFFISLFLIGIVSAESCFVDTKTNCENNGYGIILGMSDSTNAHAQLWNYSQSYDYALCCDFIETDRSCYTGGSKVLKLSSETNAHVESPINTEYSLDVCYGDLNCVLRENVCNTDEIGIASLYSQTNSHIGGLNDYNWKLCCGGMCGAGQIYLNGECVFDAVAFWADESGNSITTLSASEGDIVYLSLNNSRLAEGTAAEIQIIESDALFNDNIKTISTSTAADGSINVEWVLDSEEKANLEDNERDGVFELFFRVLYSTGEEESGTLILNFGDVEVCSVVSYCRDYENEEKCEADSCNVASISVENNDENIKCGETEYNSNTQCNEIQSCSCKWDAGKGACIPSSSYVVDNCNGTDLATPFSIGQCSYGESSEDDCSDGFLQYSWTATWTWSSENSFSENPENDNYILDGNVYRYDPKNAFGIRKSESCKGGETLVPCPAQVQLPFFGTYAFLFSSFFIFMIYLILAIKRRK